MAQRITLNVYRANNTMNMNAARKPPRFSALTAVILFVIVLTGSGTLFVTDQTYQTAAVNHNNTAAGSHQLAIVSNGWHTGLVIAAQPIQSRIPQLQQRFGNTPYLEIGWGDKGFYQAKEITIWMTLKALFWPTSTVIHAVAVPEDIDRFFTKSKIKTVCLNDKQYDQLMQFIIDSFYRNPDGSVSQLNNGIYGNSQFYQGAGTFYFMNTCNKWTARGLRSAGLDIQPMFKLTAGSVMRYLEHKHQSSNVSCSDQSNVSAL